MICNEVAIDIYTDRARASARALNGVPVASERPRYPRYPPHPRQREIAAAMSKQREAVVERTERQNHDGPIVVTQAEHLRQAAILVKARARLERQRAAAAAEALKP